MTFKRIDREFRTLSAAYSEFPLREVMQCDSEALPSLVTTLRRQRAERLAKLGECPHCEKADYGWNDGAIPSIRESGKPGSKERIQALREWYHYQEEIEEEDGSDEACSSPFLPVMNYVANVPSSDSVFSISVERSEDE